MVHLIRFTALSEDGLRTTTTRLRDLSNGFYALGPGVALIVSAFEVGDLRDWLGSVGATDVTVVWLQAQWSTRGDEQLADWLRAAAPFF